MLTVPARLTQAQAGGCLTQWLGQLPPVPTAVRLDATGLTQFDSAALAAVLALRRAVLARGQRLEVVNMPPRLAELSHLYGVDELLSN
ncbi:MAG: STAS domain-containing protein [Burkholderiales bacterium]|nr:STAS domain-containing protein [Burkholderiales bacterium]